MNHYTVTRLAEMRLQETARQARSAWWRANRPAPENDPRHEPVEASTLERPGLDPDRRGVGGTMHTPPGGLFGRDRELDEAERALSVAASGEPQALLVGGDAGIGKTAFVRAVSAHARGRGFTVLTGHCLDLDVGVPLQPVREALRAAVVDRAPEDLPPVTQRMAPFLRGASPAGEGSPIEELGLIVEELAGEHPLVIVLEDMHWADPSTQDFAVSLSRTMRRAVCLLLTFRTDELTRRHPFRRSLVEIGRSVGAHRVDLAPLGRDGIGGIVESCAGHRDSALVGSLLARSEGNPLYAEELLQAGTDSLPGPLNDLLLARVDALSAPARDLLRLASVNGSRLDPDLLGQVAGLDEGPLEACLREAIDANVVTATGDHLDFRHGLLREAVYDDLLPGERTRAHGLLAAALQQRGDDPGLAELGLLAFHWYAAHDLPAAYAASVARWARRLRVRRSRGHRTPRPSAGSATTRCRTPRRRSRPRPTWSACSRRPARGRETTTGPTP